MFGTAMLNQRLVHNRADRISALGRIAFAVPSLVAALIDPPEPQAWAGVVIKLLAGYAALATGLGLVMWARSLSARPIGQWAYAADLAVVAALVYLTNGAASPFFPLYLFATLSATLRWDWRGALGTSIVIVLLFIPTAFMRRGGLDPQTDDILRYVVRIGQVVVVGGLLAYMGAQRERVWQELLGLAQPVERSVASVAEAIDLCLDHVCRFFDVPRVIFVWELRDERGWQAVQGGPGALPLPLLAGPGAPVDSANAGVAFDFRASAANCRRYDAGGDLTGVDHPLLDAALAHRWGITEAAVAAVTCDALAGWLIIPKPVSEEDLYLARALAVQIAAALDHASVTEAWRAAAAGEERLRVAHDLHDGILQFLAGLSLQLKLIERANGHDPAAVADRLLRLNQALRGEQHDLRAFIEAIRPRAVPSAESAADLGALAKLLGQQWDITVDASAAAPPPPGLAIDVRQIIREAVANAARHGGARRVILAAAVAGADYAVQITDNGAGFPAAGHFTAADLRAAGQGPRSILDRVDRLGGRLRLATAPGATQLIVELPLPARPQT